MEIWEKTKAHISSDDRFAKHNGMEVLEVRPGFAQTRLVVAEHHLNAVGVTHGAAVFGLADLALALASNSHGPVALALNVNISFMKATKLGDILTATASEDNCTHRTGLYRIVVTDGSGEAVAVAEGLVFRKQE
ncbi:MAG TPA: hotdog fold thioesterase [Bacillota bacterium]|nr:hotdog fold thioesterase [Bacillota bacterium]